MKEISTEKFVAIIKEVASKHRHIEITIEPAVSTNSVYVILKQGEATLPFRVSDHRCPKSRGLKNIVVTPSTKRDNVVRFIENCYDALSLRALNSAFGMIH